MPAVIPAFESKGYFIGPYARFIEEDHPEKGMQSTPMLSHPYVTLRATAEDF